jgi:hypothetical protein
VAKAYWVVCYRSITNPAARAEYTKLAVPAVLACGGRYLAIGDPAKKYDAGIDLRTVVVEFDGPPRPSPPTRAPATRPHSPFWAMRRYATCASLRASIDRVRRAMRDARYNEARSGQGRHCLERSPRASRPIGNCMTCVGANVLEVQKTLGYGNIATSSEYLHGGAAAVGCGSTQGCFFNEDEESRGNAEIGSWPDRGVPRIARRAADPILRCVGPLGWRCAA